MREADTCEQADTSMLVIMLGSESGSTMATTRTLLYAALAVSAL